MRTAAHAAARACPAVPTILGFDPRYQFIHEDDIVGVLEPRGAQRRSRASTTARPTACSRSARSLGLLGKPLAADPAAVGDEARRAASSRRVGARRSPTRCSRLLRFGRGLDNRKLKATGYRFRYTTRETVLKFREALRLEPHAARPASEPYRYEREVEDFLRYSPSVRGDVAQAPSTRKNLAPGSAPTPLQSWNRPTIR